MRNLSLEQYKTMASRFNKMSFSEKIKTIRNNIDILHLGSDYNWWVVKVRDVEIQQELEECDEIFDIKNEWDSNEMHDLIALIGIDVTDV
jgi:hypothetical protein